MEGPAPWKFLLHSGVWLQLVRAFTPRSGDTLTGGKSKQHKRRLPCLGSVLPSSSSPTLFRCAPFPWVCMGLERDIWKHPVSRKTYVYLVLLCSTVRAAESLRSSLGRESARFSNKNVRIRTRTCWNQHLETRGFFFFSSLL